MDESSDGSCHIYTPGDDKLQIHSKETQFLGEVDLGFRCKFRELDDFDGNGLIGVTGTKTVECSDDITFDFNGCSAENLNVNGLTSTAASVTFAGASISPDAVAPANPSGGYSNLNAEIDALTVTATTAKSRTEGLTGGKLLKASGGGFISSSAFTESDFIQSGNTNQQTLAGDINLASGKRIKYDGVSVEISSADKMDKDFGNIPNDAVLPEANTHSSIARLLTVNTSLAGKADKTGVVFTGDVSLNTSAITANKVLTVDGNKKIVTSADNLVTDAQVTKINNCPANTTTALAAKAPTESPTLTGTVTIPSSLHGTGKFLSVDSNGAITSAVPPDTNTQYDNTDFVDLSSDQTVGGVKTFSSIPKIPTSLHGTGKFLSVDSNGVITSAVPPDTDTNTQYDNTDFVDLSSDQTVGGVKTFSSIPKIPTSLHGTGKFLSVDSNGAITSAVPPDTNTQADITGKMDVDFSNATGTIADARIPTNITRDDEVNSATNTQLNSKLNKNLDNINGVVQDANIASALTSKTLTTTTLSGTTTLSSGHTFSGDLKTTGNLTLGNNSVQSINFGDDGRPLISSFDNNLFFQTKNSGNFIAYKTFQSGTQSTTNSFVIHDDYAEIDDGYGLRLNNVTASKFVKVDANKDVVSSDIVDSDIPSSIARVDNETFTGTTNCNNLNVAGQLDIENDINLGDNNNGIFFGSDNNPKITAFQESLFIQAGSPYHSVIIKTFQTSTTGTTNSVVFGDDIMEIDDGYVLRLNQCTASKFLKVDSNKDVESADITISDVSTLTSTLGTIDTRITNLEDGTGSSWTAIGTSGGNISTGSGYQSEFALEPLQYMKRGKQVFLRGVIGVVSSGSINNNSVILNINSSDYYPTRTQSYPVACHSSTSTGTSIRGIIQINASGTNDNKIVFYEDSSANAVASTVDIHGFYWLN